MAKNKKKQKKSEDKSEPAPELSGPWISFRHGVIAIAVLSVLMAALTIYQALQVKPVGEAILIGLGYGVALWVIFFGFILINRLFGRK
jgi:hypothetical protein